MTIPRQTSQLCMRCGYQLVGPPLPTRCPECGYPVLYQSRWREGELHRARGDVAAARAAFAAAGAAIDRQGAEMFRPALLASLDALNRGGTHTPGYVKA